MARPELYRVSDVGVLPQFDIVRPGLDIAVVDGNVHPNAGGVSVFEAVGSSWSPDRTFVLPTNVSLPPGIVAHHDRGTHWLLQPAREMTLEEYKSELSILNSHAQVVCEPDASARAAMTPALPDMSTNPSRAVRFVYEGLVTASRERLTVGGWDDNDYAYLLVLASELHLDAMPLSAVTWSRDVGWTRELAFINHAIHAYMLWMNKQAEGDDDLGADAVNDNMFLRAVLGMHREGNPFAHLIVY